MTMGVMQDMAVLLKLKVRVRVLWTNENYVEHPDDIEEVQSKPELKLLSNGCLSAVLTFGGKLDETLRRMKQYYCGELDVELVPLRSGVTLCIKCGRTRACLLDLDFKTVLFLYYTIREFGAGIVEPKCVKYSRFALEVIDIYAHCLAIHSNPTLFAESEPYRRRMEQLCGRAVYEAYTTYLKRSSLY